MAKKWMQKAFSKNKGSFTRQAKSAGMSTGAYARKVLKKGSKASTRTKRRASLALLGAKISRKSAKRRKKKKK